MASRTLRKEIQKRERKNKLFLEERAAAELKRKKKEKKKDKDISSV